jgi:hypothetical protein
MLGTCCHSNVHSMVTFAALVGLLYQEVDAGFPEVCASSFQELRYAEATAAADIGRAGKCEGG